MTDFHTLYASLLRPLLIFFAPRTMFTGLVEQVVLVRKAFRAPGKSVE